MNNFPWDLYKFKLMCIERPEKELRDKLKEQGYRYVRMLAVFGETFWVHDDSLTISKEEIDKVMKELDEKGVLEQLTDGNHVWPWGYEVLFND